MVVSERTAEINNRVSYLCCRYEISLVTILPSPFVVRLLHRRHLNLGVNTTSEFKTTQRE